MLVSTACRFVVILLTRILADLRLVCQAWLSRCPINGMRIGGLILDMTTAIVMEASKEQDDIEVDYL